jgi:uncharacterized protein YlaI
VDYRWHAAGGAMCDKISLTAREANGILNDARKRHYTSRRKKIPIRKYWCDECEAWHLTSKPLDKLCKL